MRRIFVHHLYKNRSAFISRSDCNRTSIPGFTLFLKAQLLKAPGRRLGPHGPPPRLKETGSNVALPPAHVPGDKPHRGRPCPSPRAGCAADRMIGRHAGPMRSGAITAVGSSLAPRRSPPAGRARRRRAQTLPAGSRGHQGRRSETATRATSNPPMTTGTSCPGSKTWLDR